MSIPIPLPPSVLFILLGFIATGFIVSFIKGSSVYTRFFRVGNHITLNGVGARIASLLVAIIILYVSYLTYQKPETDQNQFLLMFGMGMITSLLFSIVRQYRT